MAQVQYVDHMHGRLSATRLQVAPGGGDEAETGAPSGAVEEMKALSVHIISSVADSSTVRQHICIIQNIYSIVEYFRI